MIERDGEEITSLYVYLYFDETSLTRWRTNFDIFEIIPS